MQMSFSELEYATKKKQTRRDRFLSEIEAITPWAALVATITPHYPVNDGRGRPTIALELMLRMYIAQQCFGLSDEGIEDALYDSQAIRRFVGIDLGRQSAPDATTLLNFRHLLEAHQLTAAIFSAINAHLAEQGLFIRTGTIVDATLIAAPPSTKNREGQRDSEMHQVRKGNQWYFGMKGHVGVDHKTKMIHSVAATAANVHDSHLIPDLLHGGETRVWGDSAYAGQTEKIQARAPNAKDLTQKRGKGYKYLSEHQRRINRARSRTRARVEHAIGVVKRVFQFTKVRYRGIAKNANRLFVACALANIFMARRYLFRVQGA